MSQEACERPLRPTPDPQRGSLRSPPPRPGHPARRAWAVLVESSGSGFHVPPASPAGHLREPSSTAIPVGTAAAVPAWPVWHVVGNAGAVGSPPETWFGPFPCVGSTAATRPPWPWAVAVLQGGDQPPAPALCGHGAVQPGFPDTALAKPGRGGR